MSTAPVPADESARLDALCRRRILDTGPEEAYDDIVRLAAQICATPAAIINLVDHQRVWVKAQVGCGFGEVPRGESICERTIQGEAPLIVPDASRDARFAQLPNVQGGLGVRFYAGIPLCTPDGHALGTLCVLDYRERHLDPEQLACLRALGRQAASQLEMRCLLHETAQLEAERRQATEALRESENRFQTFMDNSPAIAFIKDEAGRYLYVSGPLTRRFNMPPAGWIGRTDAELWSEEVARALGETDRAALASSQAIAVEENVPTDELGERCWLTHKFVLRGADGSRKIAGLAIDITERKQRERERERLVAELRAALAQVKTLRGFLPICAVCKNIRDDAGYWQQIESYLAAQTDLEFSHGLCPECVGRLYPDFAREQEKSAGENAAPAAGDDR